MEGPPLDPGGEDITWPDHVAPRGGKASSTRKIKPQTSNPYWVTNPDIRRRGLQGSLGPHSMLVLGVPVLVGPCRKHSVEPRIQNVWGCCDVPRGLATSPRTDCDACRLGVPCADSGTPFFSHLSSALALLRMAMLLPCRVPTRKYVALNHAPVNWGLWSL